MINLIAKTPEQIVSLLEPHADRGFRCEQVVHWVLHRHARSFDEMLNLPKTLRARLGQRFTLEEPEVVDTTDSQDGCVKYLLRLEDGATVEGVVIPDLADQGKITLCLSSQTGCALGCTFCVTGQVGAGRDLSPEEMVGQYRRMVRDLSSRVERVNIVFMGMGEPLLNTANLGQTLAVLYERVSPRRITVSTAGVIPGIRWLASRPRRPKLAVSLNAPDQERRLEIMPIARRYPLDELMDELRGFPLEPGRRITFEYVLIRDFNDSIRDARALVRLLHPVPAKVNIIPVNPDSRYLPELRGPQPENVSSFAEVIRSGGITATIRLSRGTDVAAACGQLRSSRA
jgi:23S rRNA (adenine2503-C2)-methyltransferase